MDMVEYDRGGEQKKKKTIGNRTMAFVLSEQSFYCQKTY